MKKYAYALIAALILSAQPAYSQGWNVTLAGELTAYWDNASKVVVADNYAYVATGSTGLRIIDVSIPSVPVEIGHYFTTGSAQDVAVAGDYAYVADASAGLKIINIANPHNPFEVGFCTTLGSATAVKVGGDYAYIAAGGAGLRIVNIVDPHHPIEVSGCDTPGGARDVEVCDSYAYIADYEEGLRVIDIADPLNPIETGYNDSTYASAVAVRDSLVYIAAEEAGLYVANVSNPAAPFLIGGCSVCPMGVTIDIVLQDNYAYTATPWYGMHVINISNPYSPMVVGNYYPGYPNGVAVAGDYVYLAICGGEPTGLEVISVSNPTNPIQIGGYSADGSFYDVAIADTLAYTVDLYGGFQIINISDPASPQIIGGGDGGGFTAITLSGRYAYFTWIGYAEGGLQVIDISDPLRPHWLGGCYTDYAYDVQVRGNYAYVANGSGLAIVNITNPNALVIVGNGIVPGAEEVAISGDYAYVACSGGGLRIINVANPVNPYQVGIFETGGSVTGVAVQGDYAYITDGSLHIVNVSNPSAPFAVADFALPVEHVTVAGDYAFATGASSGLYVVKITDPYLPILVGHYDTPGQAHKAAVDGTLAYVADYYNFGVYDCSHAMALSLNLALMPVNPPIVIPQNGGNFSFHVTIENNSSTVQLCDIWSYIQLPPPGGLVPSLGPIALNLPPNSSMTRLRTQVVPAGAPPGNYLYWGSVGDYPWNVLQTVNFPFVKAGSGVWGLGAGEWLNTGEPFPGEELTTAERIPSSFSLLPCNPNPFNPTTAISYELRAASFVSLRVYDTSGRLVATLVNGWREAGEHQVTFDGLELAAGIYIYRLATGSLTATGKMILLK